ncbi:MAG: hypothetical protein PHT41_06205, partial [Candidatus Omnitrophica bacterium]|nr:hypothetical protein [Candidatus Omnitrophota bacterium]
NGNLALAYYNTALTYTRLSDEAGAAKYFALARKLNAALFKDDRDEVVEPSLSLPQSSESQEETNDSSAAEEKSFEDYARDVAKVIGKILLLPFCLTGCGPATPQTPFDIPGITDEVPPIPEVPEPTPTPDGQEPPPAEGFRIPSVQIDGLEILQWDEGNYPAVMFDTDDIKAALRREGNKVLDAFVELGWSVDRSNFRVEGSDLMVDMITAAGTHRYNSVRNVLEDGFMVVVLPQEIGNHELSWRISLGGFDEESQSEPTIIGNIAVENLTSYLPKPEGLVFNNAIINNNDDAFAITLLYQRALDTLVTQVKSVFSGITDEEISVHLSFTYQDGASAFGMYVTVEDLKKIGYHPGEATGSETVGVWIDFNKLSVEKGYRTKAPLGSYSAKVELSILGAIPSEDVDLGDTQVNTLEFVPALSNRLDASSVVAIWNDNYDARMILKIKQADFDAASAGLNPEDYIFFRLVLSADDTVFIGIRKANILGSLAGNAQEGFFYYPELDFTNIRENVEGFVSGTYELEAFFGKDKSDLIGPVSHIADVRIDTWTSQDGLDSQVPNLTALFNYNYDARMIAKIHAATFEASIVDPELDNNDYVYFKLILNANDSVLLGITLASIRGTRAADGYYYPEIDFTKVRPSIPGFQASNYQLNSFFGLRDSDLRGPERTLTSVEIDTWTSQDGLDSQVPNLTALFNYNYDARMIAKIHAATFEASIVDPELDNNDYVYFKLILNANDSVLLGITLASIRGTRAADGYYYPEIDFTKVRPSIPGFQASNYQLNSFFGLRDSDLRGPERTLTSVEIDTWTSQDGLGNSIPDGMIIEITDYHDGSALLKINKSLFDTARQGLADEDYLFAKLVVSQETAVLLGMTIGGIKETQGGDYYWPLVDFTQVTGTFPGTIPGTYPLKTFFAKVDSDLRGPERQIGTLSLTSWGEGFALKETRGGAGALVCVYTPAIPLTAGLITSSIGDYTQTKQQTKAKTQMVLDPDLTIPQYTTSVAVIDDEKTFEDYARETAKVIGGILLLPFCLTGCGPITPQTPLDIPGVDNGPFDIPVVPEPTPTPDGQEPTAPEDFRIPSVSIDGLMALQRDRGNYLAVMFDTDELKATLRREANKVMDAFVGVGWSVDRNNFRVEGSDLVVDILTSAGQYYTFAISDILKDGFIVVVLPQERASYDLSWRISLADALEEIKAEPTFMNTVEVSRLNSLLPDNDNLCSYADVYGDLVVFIDKTIFENMVNQILNTLEFQGIPLSDILLHVQVAYHGGRLVYGGYTDVLNIRQYNYGIGADISEMPIEEGEDLGLLPQGPFELRYQLSTLGAIPGDRHNAFPALDESLRPASNVEITYETNQAGEDIFAIDIATLEADMISKGIPVGLDDYTLQIGRIYAAGALIDSFSVAGLKTLNPGDPIKHPAFYNNEYTIAVGETTGPYQYFFRYVKTIRISPWEEVISAVTLNPPSDETFSQEYSPEYRQLLIHADMGSLDSDLTSQNPPIPFGVKAIELSAEGLSPDVFWTRNEFFGQPGNILGVDLSAAPGFVKMRYVYGTRVSPWRAWRDINAGFARLDTTDEPCFASTGGIGGPAILTLNISPFIATSIASSVFASTDTDKDAGVVAGEGILDKATVIRFHGAKPWDGDRLKLMKFLFKNKGHKLANFAEMFSNAEVFDASDETPGGYERAKQEAIRASKEGRPLVILGYSNMGGLWGKFLGPGFLEELGNAEVDIDLLILFDDSGHHKIPANVREAINIYTLQPVPVLCLLDIIWFSTFSGVEITRNMVAEPQNALIVNFEFDKKTSNLKRTSKEDIADFEKGKYTQLVSNIYLPTRGHMDVPLNKGPEAEVYHKYIGERLLVAAERVFNRRSEREIQEKERAAEQQRVELARQKAQKESQARTEETARAIKESQERIRQLDIQLVKAEAARTRVAYRGTLDYLIPRVNADVDFAEQARLAALADNTRDIDEPRFASAGGIGGPLVLTMNTYEIVSTVQQNISTTLAGIGTAMMGAFNPAPTSEKPIENKEEEQVAPPTTELAEEESSAAQTTTTQAVAEIADTKPATTQEATVEPVATQLVETQPAAAEEATSKSKDVQTAQPIEELAQSEIGEQRQELIKALTPETTIATETISAPTRRIIEVQTSHSLIEGIGRIVSLASPESGKPNMITFIYNDGAKEEFTLRELAEKIAFLTGMEVGGIKADLGEGFGAAVSLSKAKDTFAQVRLPGYDYDNIDLVTLTLMYLAYQEGSLQAEGQETNPQTINFAQVEHVIPHARLGEIFWESTRGLGVLNPNQTNRNIHHDRVVIHFKNGEKKNYSYTELAKALSIELVALHKDLLGTVVKTDVSINGVIIKKVNLKDVLAAGFAKAKGFEAARSDIEFIEKIGKRAAQAQQAAESQPAPSPELETEAAEQVDEPKLPKLGPELQELDEMMHQQFLASPVVSEQDSSAAPAEEKNDAAEPIPSMTPI